MAGPSKKAKFKIYRQSESLFDHFLRLGMSQSASVSVVSNESSVSAVVLDDTSLEGSFEVAGNPGSQDRTVVRRMENIKAGSVVILSLQFLRSFGGFSNAKSAGSWDRAQTPMSELPALPYTPLLAERDAPLPHPPRDGSAYSQPLPFSAPQPSRLDPLLILRSDMLLSASNVFRLKTKGTVGISLLQSIPNSQPTSARSPALSHAVK